MKTRKSYTVPLISRCYTVQFLSVSANTHSCTHCHAGIDYRSEYYRERPFLDAFLCSFRYCTCVRECSQRGDSIIDTQNTAYTTYMYNNFCVLVAAWDSCLSVLVAAWDSCLTRCNTARCVKPPTRPRSSVSNAEAHKAEFLGASLACHVLTLSAMLNEGAA